LQEWLRVASEYNVTLIDAMALVVILYGSFEAFFSAIWVRFTSETGIQRREVWLRFARLLVAGLTFQLAADRDLVEISGRPQPRTEPMRQGAGKMGNVCVAASCAPPA
jgi:uncharacterized membrane protein